MAPFAPARHEVLGTQETKLLRYGRHVRARDAGELRHAPLTLRKPLEQLQTRDVSGSVKDRCRALERFVTQTSPDATRRMFVRSLVVVHVASIFTPTRGRQTLHEFMKCANLWKLALYLPLQCNCICVASPSRYKLQQSARLSSVSAHARSRPTVTETAWYTPVTSRMGVSLTAHVTRPVIRTTRHPNDGRWRDSAYFCERPDAARWRAIHRLRASTMSKSCRIY